jgi:hypothetical protein
MRHATFWCGHATASIPSSSAAAVCAHAGAVGRRHHHHHRRRSSSSSTPPDARDAPHLESGHHIHASRNPKDLHRQHPVAARHPSARAAHMTNARGAAARGPRGAARTHAARRASSFDTSTASSSPTHCGGGGTPRRGPCAPALACQTHRHTHRHTQRAPAARSTSCLPRAGRAARPARRPHGLRRPGIRRAQARRPACGACVV